MLQIHQCHASIGIYHFAIVEMCVEYLWVVVDIVCIKVAHII